MIPRLLIPLFILAAGYGAWKWLGVPAGEPKSHRPPEHRLKTERMILSTQNFPVMLETQGSVRAHHSTVLTPLVPGVIVSISPSFEDGAFFKKDEVLLALDPTDLKSSVIAALSKLARAEVILAQEDAKARQAKQNWDDIGYSEKPSPLVLRIPQLKDAQASVAAARAELDQAERNLDRAKVRAPFTGRVKIRGVGLGQAVGATTPLGEIFTTDFAEVRLPLTSSQLPFVKLPSSEDDPPVPVVLTDSQETPQNDGSPRPTWQASIVRTEGAMDEESRELIAIARIDDPFGLGSSKPELRIGQPVRAVIHGLVLKDVFAIPRHALRGLNRVFLIDQDGLTIRKATVSPIWSTDDTLVVRRGLARGDWLATSRLPHALEGAPVDLIEPSITTDPPVCEKSQTASGS